MSQTNVVQMVPTPRVYHGIKDAEAAMTVIRNAVDGFNDDYLLARRIGVSQSCIYYIRTGRTKWPRHGTFFALLAVLDLELVIRARQSE